MNANETLYQAVAKIDESTYTVCFATPPNTVSDGIWGGQTTGRSPMKSFLPVFELQVLIIFAITQICHFFLKRLGLPLFISQMMAGLILGPSIELEPLNTWKSMLFPFGSQDRLATLSSIGYVLFIFTTGVQMDFSMITRTGKKAWTFAIFGLAAPFLIVGLPAGYCLFSQNLDKAIGFQREEYLPVVVSHTGTSFIVIACLLNELKIQNSELGRLALSTAVASDALGMAITSIGVAVVNNNPAFEKKVVLVNMLSLIAFAVLIPLVCRPTMLWVIKHTPEGRPVKDSYIYLIIIMVFGLGWLSVQINQSFLLGPFILGLAVPEGPPLGSALVKKLQFFGTWFFLPIYVTTCVLKADIFCVDYTSSFVVTVGLIVLATHLVKMIACFVPALYCQMPMKDALSLVLILNSKGVVEIAIYSALYDAKIIRPQIYAVMMLSVMIIACIVQWSVKYLYDPTRKYAGYQKRSIMSSKPNSELRILACIHKRHHISPIIEAIDLCCPTTEHPIIVDALHLIELVGRCVPIFINNRFRKSNSSVHKSYSDDVILAFDIYEHDNVGAASAYTYTAISPAELMHEDVCHLALDKVASMIILPFHRRWTIDGGVDSDDKNIRSLNCKVLEIAPCSVGILVSRGSHASDSDSCIRLAMIYVGGNDDREALCLAKRAMRNPRVNLVVYHLVLEDHKPDLEDLLDNEVLQVVMHANSSLENVSYREVTAKDGTETSAFLRDIVNEHDFFIVGRRHGISSPQTEGLTDWSEFSELGAIGDLLGSPDFGSRASVLVVQQQVFRTHSG